MRLTPVRTIPASGNMESCLGPVFRPFMKIQFSDTLMSDGYFHIFLTKLRNLNYLNMSTISIHTLSELIVSDKQIRRNQTMLKHSKFLPCLPIRIWPTLRLSVKHVRFGS